MILTSQSEARFLRREFSVRGKKTPCTIVFAQDKCSVASVLGRYVNEIRTINTLIEQGPIRDEFREAST